MDKVRVGIIGSGFMGRTNAETVARYLEGAELVAITGGTRAAPLAAEYHVACEPTVEQLLERKDIDAVLISTPHSEHARQTILAAHRGKHILLDKPMATTLEDCDRILDAVHKAGVNLMIMFGQRFRICNREARRLIREGAIGRVTMIQEQILNCGGMASLPSWQSLPENSGTLLAHAVHNIDRIRWFSGQEIQSVAAQAQTDAASGNEISTMALFGLSGGSMATLWESWAMPQPGFPRTASSSWVVGETGILDVDAYGELRLGREGKWSVVARQDLIDWKGKGMLDPVRLEAYRLQHQEFIDSIREGRAPAVTGQDGRASVEAALAAYRSAAEGVTVRLPMGGKSK
ncbi:MAG TPA: Gfo/Idh/MocA family oxidoreductase [Terriglobia bacterium]|nr:Gfo/Idh/MocA family oxidoreductase [Terriglobia bacterium]